MPKIAIISIGDNLVDPSDGEEITEGHIYDTNTTMLKLLCKKYGFEVKFKKIAKNNCSNLKYVIQSATNECNIVISTGGLSTDSIMPVLENLKYTVHFKGVNMRPGEKTIFATNEIGTSYFGLSASPVATFVTFHIFILPALRFMIGYSKVKSTLPVISVIFQQDQYLLDEFPVYVGGKVSCDDTIGLFSAQIPHSTSEIASLADADVLIHLPSISEYKKGMISKGSVLKASVIDQFFVTSVSC